MAPKASDKMKHGIRFWLLRRLPTCEATVQTISQSMERTLTLRERVQLKLHLWICAWCQWYLEHLQIIREAARAKGGESPDLESSSPSLSAEARDRIKRKLGGEN